MLCLWEEWLAKQPAEDGMQCLCGWARVVRSMPTLARWPAQALLSQISLNPRENGPSPQFWPSSATGPLHAGGPPLMASFWLITLVAGMSEAFQRYYFALGSSRSIAVCKGLNSSEHFPSAIGQLPLEPSSSTSSPERPGRFSVIGSGPPRRLTSST